MALFKFLKKKSTRNRGFDDEETGEQAREFSLDKRRLNKELRELRHEKEKIKGDIEIQKLKAELDYLKGTDEEEEGSGSEDKMINMLMLKLLSGGSLKNPSPAQEVTSTVSPPVLLNLSDEDLKKAIGEMPKKLLKIAKKMPDEIIKANILKYVNVDEDTLKRAVVLVRNFK